MAEKTAGQHATELMAKGLKSTMAVVVGRVLAKPESDRTPQEKALIERTNNTLKEIGKR